MKTSILFDGSTLYPTLRSWKVSPNYTNILRNIKKYLNVEEHEINSVIFFSPDPEDMQDSQRKFLNWLTFNGFRVVVPARGGMCIDIEFVTEMMKEAHLGVEQIAIVTSNGKFTYPTRILVANGKRVVVVGPSGSISIDLMMEASETIQYAAEINA